MKILEKLFCMHDWELKDKAWVRSCETGLLMYERRLYICKKCGKFKKIEF